MVISQKTGKPVNSGDMTGIAKLQNAPLQAAAESTHRMLALQKTFRTGPVYINLTTTNSELKHLSPEHREGYKVAALDALKTSLDVMGKGQHGMYVSELNSKEYTWLTAATGILYCLTGEAKEAAALLELIKLNVPKDKLEKFTLSPEDTGHSTISHEWVSILAKIVGDLKTAGKQGFEQELHKRSVMKNNELGLYISDNGDVPKTHMNGVIGVELAQKGNLTPAKMQLELIEKCVPLYKNGVHSPIAAEAPSETTGTVAAPVAILKIMVNGAAESEEYCKKVAELYLLNKLWKMDVRVA